MNRRFGDHTFPETYRTNLEQAKKMPNENLQEYAARVSHMMRKAYPGISSSLFHSLPVDGIPDQNLVYSVLTKHPETIEESVMLLAWHRSCRTGLQTNNTVRAVVAIDDDYKYEPDIDDGQYVTEERLQEFGKDLITNIFREVAQSVIRNIRDTVVDTCKTLLGEQSENCGSVNKNVVCCFSCQEEGHISRKCPN